MPKDPARRLATLRAKLAATDEPLERQALQRQIGDLAHKLAVAQSRDRIAAARREMAGAY